MDIKKTIAVILSAAAIACTFTACDSQDGSSASGDSKTSTVQTDKSRNIEEIADKLKSDISFDEEMNELDSGKIESIFGIGADKYEKAKCYVNSSGGTPEEIDCFEAKDESAAADIKAALEKRVETQKNAFKDYNADQAPKLDDPVLKVDGKYVFLCVSGDNDKAKEIIG